MSKPANTFSVEAVWPDRCECWWEACAERPERVEQRHHLRHPESRRLCRVHFRTAMQHDLCHRCGLRAFRYGLCGKHQIQESQMTTQTCQRAPCINPDLCRRSGRCIMAPTLAPAAPTWLPRESPPTQSPISSGPGPDEPKGPSETKLFIPTAIKEALDFVVEKSKAEAEESREPVTLIEDVRLTHVSIDKQGHVSVGGQVAVPDPVACCEATSTAGPCSLSVGHEDSHRTTGGVTWPNWCRTRAPFDDRVCVKHMHHDGAHESWTGDGKQLVAWDDFPVEPGDKPTPVGEPKETRRELPSGQTFTDVLDSFIDAQSKKSPLRRTLELAIAQAKVHVAQLEGILAALSDDS